MIPDFVTIKLSKGAKLRAECILIYGADGWKARAFYYDNPKSMQTIGSGTEVLDQASATKKLGELSQNWRRDEGKKF
jgi:hypothetical protein